MHMTRSPSARLRLLAGLAIVFGLMTILSGSQALFLGPARGGPDLGNVVLPVLWFNFLAGFAYTAAGIGLWRARRWAAQLALALVAATALLFAWLGLHIAGGGAFEMRTVAAMTLRTGFWAAVAFVAWRALLRATGSAPKPED